MMLRFLLLSFSTLALAMSSAVAQPRLSVIGGDTVEFGRVLPGQYRRTLMAINTGTDTLDINGSYAPCACTLVNISRRELPPGDTMSIDVAIDASGYVERDWYKSVLISSNEPGGMRHLYLHVTILNDVHIDMINTTVLKPCKKECPWVVVLKNVSDSTVVVTPPTRIDGNGVLARFETTAPATLNPGDSVRLVGWAQPMAGIKGRYAHAYITTSSPYQPEIRIGFYAADEEVAPTTTSGSPLRSEEQPTGSRK